MKFSHVFKFTIDSVMKLQKDDRNIVLPAKYVFCCDDMEKIVKVYLKTVHLVEIILFYSSLNSQDLQLNATSTGKPIFYKEIEKKKKKSSNNTSRKKAEFQTYKRKTTRQKLGGIIDDAIFLEKLARKMDREGCCTDLLNFNKIID